MTTNSRAKTIASMAAVFIVLATVVTIKEGHGILPFGLLLYLAVLEMPGIADTPLWILVAVFISISFVVSGIIIVLAAPIRTRFYYTGRVLMDIGIFLLSILITIFICSGENSQLFLGVLTGLPFFAVGAATVLLRDPPQEGESVLKAFPVETAATKKRDQNMS